MGFNDYHVFRCDRNSNNSTLTKGGGVLIAVDNKLTSHSINIPNISLEIVVVLIKLGRNNVIISSVYIPNRASLEVYSEYFNVITEIYNFPNSNFILLGDFNIPSAIPSNTNNFFSDNVSFLNMSQFNNIFN